MRVNYWRKKHSVGGDVWLDIRLEAATGRITGVGWRLPNNSAYESSIRQ